MENVLLAIIDQVNAFPREVAFHRAVKSCKWATTLNPVFQCVQGVSKL